MSETERQRNTHTHTYTSTHTHTHDLPCVHEVLSGKYNPHYILWCCAVQERICVQARHTLVDSLLCFLVLLGKRLQVAPGTFWGFKPDCFACGLSADAFVCLCAHWCFRPSHVFFLLRFFVLPFFFFFFALACHARRLTPSSSPSPFTTPSSHNNPYLLLIGMCMCVLSAFVLTATRVALPPSLLPWPLASNSCAGQVSAPFSFLLLLLLLLLVPLQPFLCLFCFVLFCFVCAWVCCSPSFLHSSTLLAGAPLAQITPALVLGTMNNEYEFDDFEVRSLLPLSLLPLLSHHCKKASSTLAHIE